MIYRFSIVFISFLFWSLAMDGQESKLLVINEYDCEKNIFQQSYKMDISIEQFETTIDSLMSNFHSSGYWAASVDSISDISIDSIFITICLGDMYSGYRVGNDKDTNLYIHSYDFLPLFYDSLLSIKEDQGYPLAIIKPTMSFPSDTSGIIEISVSLDTVRKIYFDTIEIRGNTSLSNSFISHFLDIKRNDVFSRKKIYSIVNKIANLDYVKLDAAPTMIFYDDKVKIILNLSEEKKNLFDFIIGVLPSNENGQQKWNINGDLNLSIFNKIGYGEFIDLSYRKYGEESQILDFNFGLPHIKYLPIGINTSLNILKEGDEYLTVASTNGFSYQSDRLNYFANWKFFNSRLLNISPEDSINILQSIQLPNELDFVFNGLQIGINDREMDHPTNPRKGYSFNLTAGVGKKKIIKNNEILEIHNEVVDFAESYDTLELNKLQFELEGQYDKFFPLWSRSTIRLGASFKAKYDNGTLLVNERYMLGGSKNLRGFDENQIIAGAFGLLNLEYRLLLAQDSYLSFPFIDIGTTQERLFSTEYEMYYGVGGGLSFGTKVGMFNFAVALGRTSEIPFDLSRPKVHFGYLNIF